VIRYFDRCGVFPAIRWSVPAQRVRAHIVFEKRRTGYELALTLVKGELIDDLKVRMPSSNGVVWKEQKHTSFVRFTTP
jgi:hypothetical protein